MCMFQKTRSFIAAMMLIFAAWSMVDMYSELRVDPFNPLHSADTSRLLSVITDVVGNLSESNVEIAKQLIDSIRGAYVPKDVEVLHGEFVEFVDSLIELANSLNDIELKIAYVGIDELCRNETFVTRAIKELLADVSRCLDSYERFVASGDYLRYFDALASLAKKKNIVSTLRSRYSRYILELEPRLNELCNDVSKVVADLKACRSHTSIDMYIHVDPQIIGLGDIVRVWGCIVANENLSTESLRLAVGLRFPNYVVEKNVSLDRDGCFDAVLPAPRNAPSYPRTPSIMEFQGVVYVRSINESLGIVRYLPLKLVVEFKAPPIKIECPREVLLTQPAFVKIVNRGSIQFNVTVEIDGTPLFHDVVGKGATLIELPKHNLSLGMHTLSVRVDPTLNYVPMLYSCAIAVVPKLPRMDVSMNEIVLYPFEDIVIRGKVEGNVSNVEVAVVMNGKVVNSTKEREFVFVIKPYGVWIASLESIELVAKNLDTGINASISRTVLVVNPVGLGLLACGALVLAILASRYEIHVMLSIPMRLLRVKIQKRIDAEERRAIRFVEIGFRPAKLVDLFHEMRKLLKNYVEDLPWYTLREYASLVSSKLREVGNHVTEFVEIYERDLYSRSGITDEEAIRAKRAVEQMKRCLRSGERSRD